MNAIEIRGLTKRYGGKAAVDSLELTVAEGELLAESLLSAKGYGETVVMRGDNNATVIVDQDIEISDATVIADIVDKATDCGFENVVIVNRRDY